MATLAEIMALKEQSNPYKGLAQLGNTVADIMRTRKEKQATETAKENQAQAASLLAQASENPEQGQQLFAQAYNLAPKFVSGFVKSQKEMMGQSDKMGLEQEKLDLRRQELEARNLERELKRESDALKRQELELKLEQKRTDIEKTKAQEVEKLESEIGTIDSALGTLDELIGHPGFKSAVGWQSWTPSLPGSDAADFEAKLEQLQSQQFLNEVERMKGMGALSETEGKKIAASAGALSLDMSEEAFSKELARIKEVMTAARNKVAGKLPKKEGATSNEDREPQDIGQLSDEEIMKQLGL